MVRINPRRMWVWIVGGGLVGILWGLVRGTPDPSTGLLVGMLLGWSARSLALPWLWRPRR